MINQKLYACIDTYEKIGVGVGGKEKKKKKKEETQRLNFHWFYPTGFEDFIL